MRSAPMKPTLKERMATGLAPVRSRFNNTVSKLKVQRKKTKKLTKKQQEINKQSRKNGIIGIGLLLAVVSIAFSTTVTLTFVDGIAVYIALAPQVAFAITISYKAFSKIYK